MVAKVAQKNKSLCIEAIINSDKYPIFIGSDLFDEIPELLSNKNVGKQVLIIADSFFENSFSSELVNVLERGGFKAEIFFINAGKFNKTFYEIIRVFDHMESSGYSRDSCIIAMGGGVIGDLAGLVASLWYRGVNLLHIPTTLMAMVDSSVGGKVALNFKSTINAIGTFYHPIGVLADVRFLQNLPSRDIFSGIAETIKCGLIDSPSILEMLENTPIKKKVFENDFFEEIIKVSLITKLKFVDGDLHERGKRLFLNFGHTLGHSIETTSQSSSADLYRHGEGVALGICAALFISERHLGLDHNVYLRIKKLFDKFYLPTKITKEIQLKNHCINIENLMLNVYKDKKRLFSGLKMILLSPDGNPCVVSNVPNSLIEDAFKFLLSGDELNEK